LKEDYIINLEATAVADLVASYDCKNVILTGGEPLLQQPAWEEMIQQLREQDPHYRFEVETNGTQIPSEFMSDSIDQWNVSAKLSNSGNDEKIRIKADVLRYFASRENTWFKFVIQSAEDLTEVQQLEKTYALPKEQILLMPEGRTEAALQQKRLWLADICRDQGYRFSDRLHIQLWGSKRGV
jgi:organic radical activating enzyme